jgi:putative ABC transport system ATP-binding protein
VCSSDLNIGAVFQSCNLIANTTAVENILLSMNIAGSAAADSKEHAYGLLQSAGMGREAADRKVSRLSSGEQRRAGIARALAHGPCILLADEPTGGLEATEEAEILGMLSSLAHGQGKCVIIATQSKKVASVADELWALADGRMLLVR